MARARARGRGDGGGGKAGTIGARERSGRREVRAGGEGAGAKEGRGRKDKHPHASDNRRKAGFDLGTLVLPVGPPASVPGVSSYSTVPCGSGDGRGDAHV